MSTKNSPRRNTLQRLRGTGRHDFAPRRKAASLCLLLAVAFFAQASPSLNAARNPQGAPTPEPKVRPRTVNQNPPQPAPTIPPPAQAATPEVKTDREVSEEVDEDEVVRVDSNLVVVPASVVDNRGRAITDLKLEDFELRVDGQVKPISDLSRAETPVNITLLFDNSASLSAARAFEKQAAIRFFQSLVRPIDRAAVYSISTVPMLAQPFTNDVRRLVNTIEHFPPPEGATALYDALAQAAEYLRPTPGRKVLVLVSDGTDTVSDISFDEALSRALRNDCQVYVVQTRQIEDPNLRDTFSEQQMQKLTEQTGGAVYAPRSIQELDAAFAQLALDISQQYLLSYYPQDERKDKYFRFISLRVPSRPNARVRARKGFYPDGAQSQQQISSGMQTQRPSGGPAGNHRTDFVASNMQQPATPPLRDSLSIKVGEAKTMQDASTARTAATDETSAGRKIGPTGPDEDAGMRAASPSRATPTSSATATPEATTTPAPVNEPTPSPTPTTFSSTTPSTTPAPLPTPAPTPHAGAQAPPAPKAPAEGGIPVNIVSGGVLNSKALTLPKPTYPQAARSNGVGGTVTVEVLIDEEGRVTDARAVSGPTLLKQAAVAAARQATFSPAQLDGKRIKMSGTINYKFVWQ